MDQKGNKGMGVYTVLLLEWGKMMVHKFAFLSLYCKSPPILVDISWCPLSPTTHVLCNSPRLILLLLTVKHNALMASLPATILLGQGS
jgi:hypothetical protein